MARDTRRGGKKKVSKNIAAGVAHVNSSFNNTKILISDVQGKRDRMVLHLEQWDLKALVNLLLMLHRWQLRMQVEKLRNMASRH